MMLNWCKTTFIHNLGSSTNGHRYLVAMRSRNIGPWCTESHSWFAPTRQRDSREDTSRSCNTSSFRATNATDATTASILSAVRNFRNLKLFSLSRKAILRSRPRIRLLLTSIVSFASQVNRVCTHGPRTATACEVAPIVGVLGACALYLIFMRRDCWHNCLCWRR